jgi:polyketide synthase 12
MPEPERHTTLLNLINSHAATVLGYDAATPVPAERRFRDLGFDSLTAVELRNRLAAATGLRLPTTLVFDHPTPTAVVRYLDELIAADTPAPSVPLLADFDKLETALIAIADRTERAKAAARLRDVLRNVSSRWNDSDERGSDENKFESATDDELFEILDTELTGLRDHHPLRHGTQPEQDG